MLLAGGTVALRLALRNAATRERFDAAWLKLPLVGRLARGYNAARFASTLAMLAGAGVPILKALQAAAETLGNRAMRADAMDALVLVREGAPLASAMAQKKRFPGLLSMFARLGEQTGQLPVMLQRAANQLGAEVQRRAMQLATILEPLLIVAMGLVVMLIVLAVLLPIIQLNQFVKIGARDGRLARQQAGGGDLVARPVQLRGGKPRLRERRSAGLHEAAARAAGPAGRARASPSR